MGRENERSHIDIILDAPYVILRGTSGTTVEPGVLSGHVSLYLSEDTDIREVTLHFRGKAKIPVPITESLINSSSMQSYKFCSHDWSFLEGGCNSSTSISSGNRPLPPVRTLKAGRHLFPFTFSLTGTFPSTLTTHPLSCNTSAFHAPARPSITYKLRAMASRPGLSLGPGPLHNVHITPMVLHNLTCTMPVYVLRSLSPEALEYQLSLEMEHTWPSKLMYSIMLPHRAWAAGDTLIAVLKLSPLAKGVWVENVVTTLCETTELHVHHLKDALQLPGHGDKSKVVHNATRIVRCVKHKIVNGKAVRVDLVRAKSSWRSNTPAGSGPQPFSAMDHSSSDPTPTIDTFTPGPALAEEENQLTDEEFENHDVVTYITFPIPPTPLPVPSGSSTIPPSFSQSSSATINPTHNLRPIVVSHRIRWSFSIHNLDGHTSELRCSLPIHILDGRVLSEAREASVLTRRMALVSEGLWRGDADEEDLGLGGGAEGGESNESDIFVDRELPSYMAHVRDRVANMYYPEMATIRVPRVDIAEGGESTTSGISNCDGNVQGGFAQPRPQPQYQTISRSETAYGHLTVPDQRYHLPRASSSLPSLEHSLSSLRRRARSQNSLQTIDGPHPHTEVQSRSAEESSGGSSGFSTAADEETGCGHPVRSISIWLKAITKPFTTLSDHQDGGHGLFGSSSSHDDIHHVPLSGPTPNHSSRTRRASIPPALPSNSSFHTTSSSSTSRPHLSSHSASQIVHHSISEVPDYFVASQGFMGGVTPLSSMMGLPSYEETEREHRSRS